ncbi:hypothetical protein N7449_008113 [Penicillium cf. viridicatum]|uniref:FAD-binding PCMH-type domain-containing protein n=1 Tax=Penicillium cf. viridicatum TaxID=2972119 RepID=A0A9W9MDC4_9EURO|nr:hypothetical protein N7449_008113 [Penicillium cf. viridicatum]
MKFATFLLLLGAPSVLANCRCTPTDDCWPSVSRWNGLNSTVNGKLIANQPLAKPCYNGLGQNSTQCQDISKIYTESSFRESSPIGFAYPVIDTCAPVNGSIAGVPVCDLGSAPVYSINATKPADVAAGIKFAKKNNVRLVIKNTGHDVRARSQGYGSLSIWMKYIKPELQFQDRYQPSNSSCESNWTGSAIVVGGGYIWDEVYTFAAKHGHIAVGGSSKTVGAVGGYIQGGGHGPVTHDFGLATDQVLEYKVVLASGEVVTANACSNVDLFTALRGGGGGTFGVVVSAIIRVYPTRPVLKHSFTVAPPTINLSTLINATASILSKYPTLSNAGYSGNAQITRVLGAKSVYSHNLMKMLSSNVSSDELSSEIEEARNVMQNQLVDLFQPINGTDFNVSSTFKKYDTFHDYFQSESHESPTLNYPSPAMVSRFWDKKSLVNNHQNLTAMFGAIFPQSSSNVQAIASLLELSLIGGGEVLKPKPHTAVHPGWRKTYLFMENFDVPPADSGLQGVRQVREYAISKKLNAMKAAAPSIGTYMNEADSDDPDWKEDFYGEQYNSLNSVKQKYDPDGVFWCYRCVGSEGWEEVTGPTLYGPLCQRK